MENITTEMKQCSKCKELRPIEWFRPRDQTSGKLRSLCRVCNRENDRKRDRTRDNRARYLHRTYGITKAIYDELLRIQDGHCALCPATDPQTVSGVFHVDHDHRCCKPGRQTCGKCIRGLLCHPCNTQLGWIEKCIAAQKIDIQQVMAYVDARAPITLAIEKVQQRDEDAEVRSRVPSSHNVG